jgi:two-component system response regulator LytT
MQLMTGFKNNNRIYKQSFLVHYKDKLVPVGTAQIAWFYTENELVYAVTSDKKQYLLDQTMEQLQQQLDSSLFFRVNRQYIVQRKSIHEIEFYFNGRLLVKILPETKEQVLISKARVTEFKSWMNS